MRKRWVLLAVFVARLALAAKPSSATGRIVDAAGKPIAGAEVCSVVPGGAPGLCAHSRDDGSYDLPSNESGDVRIVLRGYLPRTVSAVAQGRPIVLEKAAALRIRVIDRATGNSAATAEVDIVYSTGRKLGAFPVNASGLSLPTLPAGDARVVVRSPGYKDATSDVVHLEAGKQSEAVVSVDSQSGKLDPQSGK